MADVQAISANSFTVPNSILLHPLFVQWSALTLGQITAARPALIQDLNAIYPTQESAAIAAYLASLLYLVGGASSGLLSTIT